MVDSTQKYSGISRPNRISNPEREAKIRFIINILGIFGIILTAVLFVKGYRMELFTSPEALEIFLQGLGKAAPFVFVIIQIIQTVIPIIPGALTCPAGAMIFGVGYGFLLNFIGIMIGSCANFFLARKYGRSLVKTLAGEKTYGKYIGWLDQGARFDKLFTFGMFFPVSPADFLCLMAGLSSMSFKKFFVILALGKPITLFLYTYGITEVIKLVLNFIQ